MNQEELFAKSLKDFMIQARTQGNVVSKEQIHEQFASMSLNDEQMGYIKDYLAANKIGVEEELSLDDYLSEEEKNYLELYLEEIEVFANISEEEKLEITKRAIANDAAAKEKLIQMYLPKVVSIAKLYTGQGVLLEDLIGEGNIGLTLGSEMLVCCESEEEVEGMIGKMIMDAMEDLIAEDTMHSEADKVVVERINELSEKVADLTKDLQQGITIDELVNECDYTKEEIMELIRISGAQIELLEGGSE